jgi:hypothetical protein
VHDDLPGTNPLGRDPVQRAELAQRRHESLALGHALALHAQDVDDIRLRDIRYVGRDAAAEHPDPTRQKRRRADDGRVSADQPEGLDERARNPRVENVAHDRDLHAGETPESLLHGVDVQERLGRVLVLAVPGVHDVCLRETRDEPRGADRRMSND